MLRLQATNEGVSLNELRTRLEIGTLLIEALPKIGFIDSSAVGHRSINEGSDTLEAKP